MDQNAVQAALHRTLAELPLSRSERRDLRACLEPLLDDPQDLPVARALAFDLGRQALTQQTDPEAVLDWLEEVVKTIQALHPAAPPSRTDAYFSPGPACRDAIVAALRNTRRQADLCVFTISDDVISEAIVAAHRRGVRLRLLSDDDKAHDAGSDVLRLARAGLDVRVDQDPEHMHHKFALFDARLLLTGSYNWTRSAAEGNQENIVCCDDANAVRAFSETFERLWAVCRAPR